MRLETSPREYELLCGASVLDRYYTPQIAVRRARQVFVFPAPTRIR